MKGKTLVWSHEEEEENEGQGQRPPHAPPGEYFRCRVILLMLERVEAVAAVRSHDSEPGSSFPPPVLH